jgi:hypothetical protein
MKRSHLADSVRALEAARTPTSTLVHMVADACAQALANALGDKVSITLGNIVVVSRAPQYKRTA